MPQKSPKLWIVDLFGRCSHERPSSMIASDEGTSQKFAAPKFALPELIARLGKPPSEICLDWAWQLQQFAPQHLSASSAPAPPTAAGRPAFKEPALKEPALKEADAAISSSRCDWSPLLLDANGQLHWDPAARAVTTHKLEALRAAWLDQLQRWSEAPSAASNNGANTPATLEQRTVQWAQDQPTSQRPSAHTSPTAAPTSPSSHWKHATRRAARPAKPRRGGRHQLRKLGVALGLIGLLLMSVVLYGWELTNHDARTAIDRAERTTPGSARAARVADMASSDKPRLQTGLEKVAASPNAPLVLSTAAIEPGTAATLFPHSAMHNLPSTPYPNQMHAGQHAAATSEAISNHEDSPSQPDPPELSLSDSSGSVGSPATAHKDVLAEMAELSLSAEAHVSEQLIPSREPEVSPARPAPLRIETFPMIQTQKFDKSLRPRHPCWRLRLAVGEGLLVSPDTEQTLVEEQQLNWTIRAATSGPSDDSKIPTRSTGPQPSPAMVLVQVQLSGKREPSLRWRIAAISERYPQLALPLERKLLDQFQDYLGHTTTGLQQESGRLKQLSRTTGLPSQARSSLTTLSRTLEEQRKLAVELLEIVAAANQMVGWLDGQIDVHGELLESAATPSTALLQFGVP